jgi:hypothetical protein
MITVHVIFHKDGDLLSVVDVPRWTNLYDKMLGWICPCCSWRGRLWDKITNFDKYGEDDKYKGKELLYIKYFDKWGRIYLWAAKFEKTLYETKVDDACLASQKIFDKKEPCWRDDCEHCWHLREDAYTSGTNSRSKGK